MEAEGLLWEQAGGGPRAAIQQGRGVVEAGRDCGVRFWDRCVHSETHKHPDTCGNSLCGWG